MIYRLTQRYSTDSSRVCLPCLTTKFKTHGSRFEFGVDDISNPEFNASYYYTPVLSSEYILACCSITKGFLDGDGVFDHVFHVLAIQIEPKRYLKTVDRPLICLT